MDRTIKGPEKNAASQGQRPRRTDYMRRIASQSNTEYHRPQDQPAANPKRTSSSQELKIKPGKYSASGSRDANRQVQQSIWKSDSGAPKSSHKKKSSLSQQYWWPIQGSSSMSHLVGARSFNAGHQKEISALAGGGSCFSKPSGDDSSSQQQKTDRQKAIDENYKLAKRQIDQQREEGGINEKTYNEALERLNKSRDNS